MFYIQNQLMLLKWKVDDWFKRVFKEQAGGAELVATLVIVGIVLCLAFAFRTQITDLVKQLWNNLVAGDNAESFGQGDVAQWE